MGILMGFNGHINQLIPTYNWGLLASNDIYHAQLVEFITPNACRKSLRILVESAVFPHQKSPCLLVEMLVSHDFWYPMKSPWNSMKSPFLNCWCLSLLPEMPHFAKAKRPVAWSCHTLMAPWWRPNGRTQNDLRWAPQSARAARQRNMWILMWFKTSDGIIDI